MSNKRYQGKIIRWKEDRGFGFIKVPSIEKDIFLHISALQNIQRRPKIGDVIYFDLQFEAGGKLKAIRASFTEKSLSQPTQPKISTQIKKQNYRPKTSYQRNNTRKSFNRRSSSNLPKAIVVGLLLAGVVIVAPKVLQTQPQATVNSTQNPTPQAVTPTTIAEAPSSTRSCNIKGNISYPDGKKFYHKPGYRDYNKVEIFPNEGERWFCTEEEAVQAGWKDAENR
jgi:cold shock CspA family protein